MTSRRNSSRNRNSYQNSDNRGNLRGKSQQSGNTKTRMNQYFCDLCGANVPKHGNSSPLCPRCMVPMHQLKGGGKNKGRQFDYSARIFYQTDGHPQYKNLPKDHPDPEDEKAVEEYYAKKERMKRNIKRDQQERQNRSRKGGNRRQSGNRNRRPGGRNNPDGQETKARKASSPGNKSPKNDTADRPKSAPEESTTQKPKSSENQREPGKNTSERRPRNNPRRRKKVPLEKSNMVAAETPAEKPAAPPKKRARIKEEDYAGTALISDKSAATILSETLGSSGTEPVDS